MTANPEAFHSLQLLEDLSAKHWTSVFWYEYRHKREVRQFDDEETKMNNAKKEMENIVLGNYQIKDDLAIVGADAEQMALVRKTAQLRKAHVQDVAFLVTDRHPDTGVITVNRPLFVGENSRFYRFKVHCSI
jgi:phosphoribosylpyrophosphate synthetase